MLLVNLLMIYDAAFEGHMEESFMSQINTIAVLSFEDGVDHIILHFPEFFQIRNAEQYIPKKFHLNFEITKHS